MVALPSDHPLAWRGRVMIADLAGEPFVTFPGAQGSSVREALLRVAVEAGFAPTIVREAPDSSAILSLSAAGPRASRCPGPRSRGTPGRRSPACCPP
ncbi:LysR substrate-binding domain-containing protein [Rothia santali]|uniref:LysR substrate-binding domain-containing protein n=1 Tax=Rothia santali TaxID=2949643 RepID=UPI00359F2751